MANLKITWVKSATGYAEDQLRTVKSLGLKHLNDTVVQVDSMSLRGMINKVRHLVQVEVAE